VLGKLHTARNLLVINDEAHHAWRIPAGAQVSGVSRQEVDEATKWIGGLDRIQRARGILVCHDLTATPFVPSGKKSSDEALFSWIVSDFGLNDAIESGLVKTPRVVVRDDSGAFDAEYRSRLYHIYNDDEVKDDLNRKAEPHDSLPDLVTNGYYLLGKDWLETRNDWAKRGAPTPPVMITVANRTETAARVKYAFDKGRIRIDELCDAGRTLHIDSKVLASAEEREEATTLNAHGGGEDADDGDESTADDAPVRKLTKDQQAELLRRVVDTVGRVGEPGEPIQNVISVGMLSEGWDAKTVTHIMGLRAFTSQLLCEQVVGRGLRRTSYEVNPDDGLFEPEYVNIFGVPFTFLPHEGGDGPPPPPPSPKTRIEALPAKQDFEISWPNVLRIEHVYEPRLTLDIEHVEPLEINAYQIAFTAEMAPIVAGKPNVTMLSDIELTELAQRYRMQRLVFEAAVEVFDQMKPDWRGSREFLLAQLIGLVERFMRSDRLHFTPESINRDELRKRMMLTLSMKRLVQHIWQAIRAENTECLRPVFDSENPIRSTADMRPWYTGRPNHVTERSHVSHAVFDQSWEASEAYILDHSPHVTAWVKNDHLGFEIVYVFEGIVHKYRPDFLVRLTNGTTLVLEVKGRSTPKDEAKRLALEEWVKAINGHGGFGRWANDVSWGPNEVADVLHRLSK
jgi:type III restriction enzyme